VGTGTVAKPVKLIASIIYGEERHFVSSLEPLVDRWGSFDLISEALPFDYTDYYEKEMGTRLQRRVVSFESLIDPGKIAAIKGGTNEIEEVILPSSCDGRAVNIDPGYVSGYHLLLASTKPAPHRPYLQQGIYADVTLVFQDKRFQALPWTYPDYQSEKMIAIFCAIRQKYLFQRKHHLCAG
jgi:hypothetical protein